MKLKLPRAKKLKFGERLSDIIAEFGGSWRFILAFLSFMTIWIIINNCLGENGWDHYPFILLNLGLSCLAALQAPVIMMSQNRLSIRDRARDELDLQVNIIAEEEIRAILTELKAIREDITKLKTPTE